MKKKLRSRLEAKEYVRKYEQTKKAGEHLQDFTTDITADPEGKALIRFWNQLIALFLDQDDSGNSLAPSNRRDGRHTYQPRRQVFMETCEHLQVKTPGDGLCGF